LKKLTLKPFLLVLLQFVIFALVSFAIYGIAPPGGVEDDPSTADVGR